MFRVLTFLGHSVYLIKAHNTIYQRKEEGWCGMGIYSISSFLVRKYHFSVTLS